MCVRCYFLVALIIFTEVDGNRLNHSQNVTHFDKIWIVDVRDVNTKKHLCTGSLVNYNLVLTPCSCIVSINSTHRADRIVIFSFKGEYQERPSTSHFPHIWCEPVGASGRPTFNYAITLLTTPFNDAPNLSLLPLPSEVRATRDKFKRIFWWTSEECESVGWTANAAGKSGSVLTSISVKPGGSKDVRDETWLVGRVAVAKTSEHDGSPGRVLVCRGVPYGFLDSWSDDRFDRYYRLDHIVGWIIASTVDPMGSSNEVTSRDAMTFFPDLE